MTNLTLLSSYIVSITIIIQPSATHNDPSEKTVVDVTWQVPGNPANSNVTLW